MPGPGPLRATRQSQVRRQARDELTRRNPMSSETFEQHVPGGVVHKLPADLRKALIANTTALAAWKGITPLAPNDFMCWVEAAKQQMTRGPRIRRTEEEVVKGP